MGLGLECWILFFGLGLGFGVFEIRVQGCCLGFWVWVFGFRVLVFFGLGIRLLDY